MAYAEAVDNVGKSESTEVKNNGVYHLCVRWTLPHGVGVLGYGSEQVLSYIREFKETITSLGADHFIFQIEDSKGDGSNVHIQSYLHVKDKVRPIQFFTGIYNALKKPGQTIMQFHVSPASNEGKEQLKLYSMKDSTRVAGPWSDKKIYMGQDIKHELKKWQADLEKTLLSEPNDRTVLWLTDTTGCTGKTYFCKHMFVKHKACVIRFASCKDMLQVIADNKNKSVYIFDLSRTKPADFKMEDLYSVCEALKDGLITSGKYHSVTWAQETAHVLVMSNWHPKKEAMSGDRWHCMTIGPNGEIS